MPHEDKQPDKAKVKEAELPRLNTSLTTQDLGLIHTVIQDYSTIPGALIEAVAVVKIKLRKIVNGSK